MLHTSFMTTIIWLRPQVDVAEREVSGSNDPRPRTRTAAPRMAAWAAVDAATTREETLACLEDLREDGEASLWNSFRLAPRPVSLGELCRTTKLEESVLDPTASEFSLEDIQGTFIKVTLTGECATGRRLPTFQTVCAIVVQCRPHSFPIRS